MLANPSFVHDVLTDVMTRGAVTVDKKKLLFALGAKQDRGSAWTRLLDAWEELDNPRGTLRGNESWNMTIILASEQNLTKTVPIEQVTNWE